MSKKNLTVEQLNKKAEKLEQENANLKQTNASFNEEIQGLKNQNTALEQEKKGLNDLVVEYQNKNLDLIEKNEALDARTLELKDDLKQLTERTANDTQSTNADEVSIKLNQNHPSIVYFRAGLQFDKAGGVFTKNALSDKLAVLQADSNLIIE